MNRTAVNCIVVGCPWTMESTPPFDTLLHNARLGTEHGLTEYNVHAAGVEEEISRHVFTHLIDDVIRSVAWWRERALALAMSSNTMLLVNSQEEIKAEVARMRDAGLDRFSQEDVTRSISHLESTRDIEAYLKGQL